MVRLLTSLLAACGLLAERALGALDVDLNDTGSCAFVSVSLTQGYDFSP